MCGAAGYASPHHERRKADHPEREHTRLTARLSELKFQSLRTQPSQQRDVVTCWPTERHHGAAQIVKTQGQHRDKHDILRTLVRMESFWTVALPTGGLAIQNTGGHTHAQRSAKEPANRAVQRTHSFTCYTMSPPPTLRPKLHSRRALIATVHDASVRCSTRPRCSLTAQTRRQAEDFHAT
jgi:hypothetical protein